MFNVKHDSETTSDDGFLSSSAQADAGVVTNFFIAGMLLGLLVGEGHFGEDGKQPHPAAYTCAA
jgi:hypothetical protein